MLKESAVFFVLLGLFGIGFGQALMGLDVADEKRDSTESESTLSFSLQPCISHIPRSSFSSNPALLSSRFPIYSRAPLLTRLPLDSRDSHLDSSFVGFPQFR